MRKCPSKFACHKQSHGTLLQRGDLCPPIQTESLQDQGVITTSLPPLFLSFPLSSPSALSHESTSWSSADVTPGPRISHFQHPLRKANPSRKRQLWTNTLRQKFMEVCQRLNIGFSVGTMWLKRLLLTVVKGMVKKRWAEPYCHCSSTSVSSPWFLDSGGLASSSTIILLCVELKVKPNEPWDKQI